MTDVLMKLTVHARGEMATKLLEAADTLGLDPGVVRSQSDGFLVPTELHQYLFPSQYDDVQDDQSPAEPDPADLTEAQLEALTAPSAEDL
jgi:hypothetical protein